MSPSIYRSLWILLALSCALASPARAQIKLELIAQQARLEMMAETVGLALTVEVRDRCSTVVKKEPVELYCSEWRPFVPLDIERKPFFRGHVMTPSGKEAKLIGRRGPRLGGEVHALRLTLTGGSGSAPEPLSWELDHDADRPGTWLLDAAELGRVLLYGGDGSGTDWELEVVASTQGNPTLWESGAGRTLTNKLPALVRASVDARWRCEQFMNWNESSSLADVVERGKPTASLPIERLAWSVDHVAAACTETSETAREQLCALSDAVVEGIASNQPDPVLAGKLLLFCPDEFDVTIYDAIGNHFEGLAAEGKLAEAADHLVTWTSLGATGWAESTRSKLSALASAALAPVVEAADIPQVTEFIGRYRASLGADWVNAAIAQRSGLVEAELEAGVAANDIAGVTAVLERHREIMDAAWLERATVSRAGLMERAWAPAAEKNDIPQLITLMETHGGSMGTEWAQASRTDVEKRIQTLVNEAAFLAGDARKVMGLAAAYGAFVGPDWLEATQKTARGLSDEKTDALLATEDIDGASAWAKEVEPSMGPAWKTATDARIAAMQAAIASGPPLMAVFAAGDDDKTCMLSILRPVKPARILRAYPLSQSCSEYDTGYMDRHDNKLVLTTGDWDKRTVHLLDLDTGSLTTPRALPRGARVRGVGFDDGGTLLAVAQLSAQQRESRDGSSSWFEQDGVKYPVDEYSYGEPMLWRTYRRSRSSWRAVDTMVVELAYDIEGPVVAYHASTEPLFREYDSAADFQDGSEEVSNRQARDLYRLTGEDSSYFEDENGGWVMSSGAYPKVVGSWLVGDVGHWPGPLLWETSSNRWEVIPGSQELTSYSKRGRYLLVSASDGKEIHFLWDLQTRTLLWELVSPVKPQWFD